jgi:hypothetical protein
MSLLDPFSRSSDDLTQTSDMALGVGSDASIDLIDDVYSRDRFEQPSQTLSEADTLRYQHPDYRKNILKWEKYVELYESEEIYRFLFKHMRESEEMYQKRLVRGYFYNYVASVVDLYIAYIFHSPITRQVDETLFEDLYSDADLQGTRFEKYIQIVATYSQLTGHVGVLVDMPKIQDGGFISEKDRKEANHRPYCTTIHARQILDWETDKFGNFVWVKLEIERPQDRLWNKPVDEEIKHFLKWTRVDWEEWELKGDQARKIDEGKHSLGEVPFVILRNKRKPRHLWFGVSAVRDIADINIGILNWSSLGDEEIYERCLNVLAMEQDIDEHIPELSHHNVLSYAPGAEPPRYLTPGSSPLEMISNWIERAKDEIYRLAKFGGSVGLHEVRQATSGIAYAFEFNETNQALADKASNIEEAEIKIHRLYAKWLDEPDAEVTIEYPDEFGVEDFLMEFQLLAEGRTTLSSETAIKEMEKKLLTKMFAGDHGSLRDKITKEVDEEKVEGPIQANLLDINLPRSSFTQVEGEPKAGRPGRPAQQGEFK